MSLHFVSHPWEVQDVEDGTLVRITPQDLGVEIVAVLVDELFDLTQEFGRSDLFLDLQEVRSLPSQVAGKLFALDRKLKGAGGRLVLCNLDAALYEQLQARPAGTREATLPT